MPDDTLVFWSARASGMAFFAAVLLGGRQRLGVGSNRAVRLAWTVGCLLLLAHEALAMGLAFGWSQRLAWENIAAQSREATGFDSGVGLIVNYATGAFWVADTAWWWMSPASYLARPRWISALIWTYLAAMFLFGAVVFAAGTVRAVASSMFVIAGLWIAYVCASKRTVSKATRASC